MLLISTRNFRRPSLWYNSTGAAIISTSAMGSAVPMHFGPKLNELTIPPSLRALVTKHREGIIHLDGLRSSLQFVF